MAAGGLEGMNALVIGGSRGIGLAIAESFRVGPTGGKGELHLAGLLHDRAEPRVHATGAQGRRRLAAERGAPGVQLRRQPHGDARRGGSTATAWPSAEG